jgi:hypothetical protein
LRVRIAFADDAALRIGGGGAGNVDHIPNP